MEGTPLTAAGMAAGSNKHGECIVELSKLYDTDIMSAWNELTHLCAINSYACKLTVRFEQVFGWEKLW